MRITPEQKYSKAWKLMMEACKEGNWGDPFLMHEVERF